MCRHQPALPLPRGSWLPVRTNDSETVPRPVEYARKAYNMSRVSTTDRAAILAAAYAQAGDFRLAAKWQSTAISMAPKTEKGRFAPALDLYEQGKPYRDEKAHRELRPSFELELQIGT